MFQNKLSSVRWKQRNIFIFEIHGTFSERQEKRTDYENNEGTKLQGRQSGHSGGHTEKKSWILL